MVWSTYTIGGVAVGGLIAIALAVVGTVRRRRVREAIRSADPVIEDGDIERILHDGVLRKADDPPLDLDEIASEERQFWESESWDASDEW